MYATLHFFVSGVFWCLFAHICLGRSLSAVPEGQVGQVVVPLNQPCNRVCDACSVKRTAWSSGLTSRTFLDCAIWEVVPLRILHVHISYLHRADICTNIDTVTTAHLQLTVGVIV